jgi:threonine/homoserine efflux transporter RhtA
VAIFALISGSTGAILLCACDHPGGRPLAELQIVIAFLLGGLAVFLIYRELEQRSDSTGFMKACGAVAFVAAAIYIELKVAVRCVEWLARP